MKKLLLLLIVIGVWFSFDLGVVYAQKDVTLTEYKLLEPLPFDSSGELKTSVNAGNYIPGLFRLVLAIAGVLVVVRIIYAGILYMSSDAYSGKSAGKEIINDALWGLALTLGAWILVATLFDTPGDTIDLTIKIPAQDLPANTNPPDSGGGGGSGGSGCQGECPYSYTNGSSNISYKDCINCVTLKSLGLFAKVGLVNGLLVSIDSSLGTKLKSVNDMGTPFIVTEAWPPTFNHRAQGHYDGTAADVKLNNNSVDQIKKFLDNSNTVGLRAVYETSSYDEKTRLNNLGVPSCSGSGSSGCVLVLPSCPAGGKACITGSHFSIYK